MTDMLHNAWQVLAQMAPLLLLGFLAAGVLRAFVPERLFMRALAGRGIGSIVRATLVGIPLPLCSCGVVPVAVDLRQRGASRGAVTAFLVSTPETGVDSIAASFGVLSPWLAIARPVVATISALVAGLLVEWGGRGASAAKAPECCGHTEPTTKGLLAGLRYAFVDLFEDVGLWLLPAVLVSAVLTATLEPGVVARYVSSQWLQMAVLLVVGVPVYVCATAATPLAAALIASGFSPGAALVFLLVGPATNVVTIVAAKKMLGTRGAVLYVAGVAATAVAGGLLLDALLSGRGVDPAAATRPMHEHTGKLGSVCAVILLALIVRVWLVKLARR